MKKNIWLIYILALLVVFASSGAVAMNGMMQKCPMMQDGQCSGDVTKMECQSMQQTNTMTQAGMMNSGDAMNMNCSSMNSGDHTACICDHSSGSGCVNNTGMMCMCCDMCADSGMCPEGCCAMNMLEAVIDITPGNLNLLGKGKFITVYIELAENADNLTVDDIDKNTIYWEIFTSNNHN